VLIVLNSLTVDGAQLHNYVCLAIQLKQVLLLVSASRAGIKGLVLVLLALVGKIVDHVLFGTRTVSGANPLMELVAVRT